MKIPDYLSLSGILSFSPSHPPVILNNMANEKETVWDRLPALVDSISNAQENFNILDKMAVELSLLIIAKSRLIETGL